MTAPFANPTSVTAGFDFGACSVKMAILSHSGATSAVVAKAVVQIPRSGDGGEVRAAVRETWRHLLTEANLSAPDVDNMASTGADARHVVRVGHLYGPSVQALGARLLFPDATVALGIEGDHIYCALLKDRRQRNAEARCGDHPPAKLVRGAAVSLDEPAAAAGGRPATDCLETRVAMLLRSLAPGRTVVLTGETALDPGFAQRLWSRLLASQSNVSLLISPEALFTGACGAAILAGRRFTQISRSLVGPFGDPSVASAPARGNSFLN